MADTLARADGREIRLEEEPTLNLALMLPDDGYSCEVIRGVPPGLAEFLAPLQRDGLCRMAPQPTSSGFWTIYMVDHHNNVSCPYFFQLTIYLNYKNIVQIMKKYNCKLCLAMMKL